MNSTAEPITEVSTRTGFDASSIHHYRAGAPGEMAQYAFFIGRWDCTLRLPSPGPGEPLALRGTWVAEWRHAGRILVDDLTVFTPEGDELLGWLNLRTWCAETGSWQISSHRALAPCTGTITHGHQRNGEIHLEFDSAGSHVSTQNRVRFRDITDASFAWVWQQRAIDDDGWRTFASISAQRQAAAG